MSAAPKPTITPQQYLEMERQAEFKSEYYNRQMLAMPGVSPEHSLIAANVIGELGQQLRDTACRVYTSDLRVHASEALYTYPDVTVVCGALEFSDERRDSVTNPTVIIEVLSPTTEAWDRGGKFEQYRQRQSLQEYVLITRDRPHVERFARRPDGQWLMSEVKGLDGVMALPSIGCELALTQVYLEVEFPTAPTARPADRSG
jgi:Uma2 family endonuclease